MYCLLLFQIWFPASSSSSSESSTEPSSESSESEIEEPPSEPILSEQEMNDLAAKMMRAELMGNTVSDCFYSSPA